MNRYKYPRTPHLPWSPGATPDDIKASDVSHFVGREIVVTEKMDGECTTIYADGYVHARSTVYTPHPSRTWIKSHAAYVYNLIPCGLRVIGENVYARHSIGYSDLESYFFLFSVAEGTYSYEWDAVEEISESFLAPTVPVLYRGVWDEDVVRSFCLDNGSREGIVVRTAGSFDFADMNLNVAKWVRPNHVTTDEHWMHRPVVQNGLRG